MKLSKRLLAVASQVSKNSIIADIGTDHGYLPIYLFENNVIHRAIASDVNKGPLEKAKKNIMENQLEDVIEIRLGNGLEILFENEVDTIILAGMGGMLIIDILNDRPHIVQSVNRLVMQPQLDQEELRKYLHGIDFQIIEEQMVYEEGKYYWIISAEPGKEKYRKDIYYIFGKILIEKKEPLLKKYIEEQLVTLKSILIELNKSLTDNSKRRIKEIKKDISYCEEVLKCL